MRRLALLPVISLCCLAMAGGCSFRRPTNNGPVPHLSVTQQQNTPGRTKSSYSKQKKPTQEDAKKLYDTIAKACASANETKDLRFLLTGQRLKVAQTIVQAGADEKRKNLPFVQGLPQESQDTLITAVFSEKGIVNWKEWYSFNCLENNSNGRN